jgi:hypothetical protein
VEQVATPPLPLAVPDQMAVTGTYLSGTRRQRRRNQTAGGAVSSHMSRDSEKLTERAPSATPHTPTCRWPAQTTRLGPLATSRPRDAKHEPDPTRSGVRRGSDFTGDRVQDCRRVPYGDPLAKTISAGGGRGQPMTTSWRWSFANGRRVEQHHRAQAPVTRTARAQTGVSVPGAANPPRRSRTDVRRTSCGRGTASRRPGVRRGQALICRTAISCLSRPAS